MIYGDARTRNTPIVETEREQELPGVIKNISRFFEFSRTPFESANQNKMTVYCVVNFF